MKVCVVAAKTRLAKPADTEIAAALMDLAYQRGSTKTFCPSEIARSLTEDWRSLMPDVRRVAQTLPLKVTQKGDRQQWVDVKGPIRLSLDSPESK